jgi:hypothetical protein
MLKGVVCANGVSCRVTQLSPGNAELLDETLITTFGDKFVR